jgi:uncharacterized protein (DUF1778 family)
MRSSSESSFDGQMTRRQRDSSATAAAGETSTDCFSSPMNPRTQDVSSNYQRIALNQDEAARFLDALETVDQSTVVRLRELRERA